MLSAILQLKKIEEVFNFLILHQWTYSLRTPVAYTEGGGVRAPQRKKTNKKLNTDIYIFLM